jgi:hypothetical protein
MCCGQPSGSYAACSPFGAVSGRNHTDTWAGCIVSLTIPTRPLPTNLMLMVLVSWGGGEVYSSTSTSSPGHGNLGGGSSIPLHTTWDKSTRVTGARLREFFLAREQRAGDSHPPTHVTGVGGGGGPYLQ